MAATLWGKVYYNDSYAGELRQGPGGRCVFTYDRAYLDSGDPPVAFTLPPADRPYINENGLHPFFDNLGAEGWLRNAQARALKVERLIDFMERRWNGSFASIGQFLSKTPSGGGAS